MLLSVSAARIVDLPADHLTVLKLVGHQTSLEEYVAAHPPRTESDWASIYFQLSVANAMGTYAYRIDQGYDTANLLELQLAFPADVRVLLIGDEWFAAPEHDGATKAMAIKRLLTLDAERPLMEQLAERRLLLLCRESADEWELVVPLSLRCECVTTSSIVARVRLDRARCCLLDAAPGDDAAARTAATLAWIEQQLKED
jgi:hypothetical protein